MILVTGATGNVGREVAAGLVRRGEPVRALVRDPARAALPDGVEAAAGDLARPESTRSALRDVDRLFLLPGYPGMARVAADAGVTRTVQLSGGSAGSGDQSNAVTRYMERSEQEIRETEMEWTFLRPCAFMSNTLRWLPQLTSGDVVRAPFANVPLASVDPADIAAVAIVALVEDGHHAMIYRPTGPEALLPEQQVAVLAGELRRPLRFEAQANDDARRAMLETTPPEYVGAFFDFYVNGSIDESTVRPTVRDVTGRPPATLETWARNHAAEFTAG
jgi:uncharacterized protein YbjT (DUF2867 family)